MQRAKLLFSAILVFTSYHARSQGCSDAGFCTTGALQSHSSEQDTALENTIGISISAGKGERSVLVFNPQVEWGHSWRRSLRLEVKLPYYLASGNLGTTGGLGDPIATITKSLKGKGGWDFFATAGVRVSLTDAAKVNPNGRPLPMPYQTGLGTSDIILGAAAQYSGWLFFSGGYQQPVIQYNENGYLAAAYPQESTAYRSYFDSRKLVRKGDVLLRAEGQIRRKQITLSGGPLLICHLGQDRVTEQDGTEHAIPGSSGITLNLTAKAGWRTKRSQWELSGGTPLLVRDTRPDGLTRSVVLTLRYARLFTARYR